MQLDRLSYSQTGFKDTDFRFNRRIMSFLDTDHDRVERSLLESSIFKSEDTESKRSVSRKSDAKKLEYAVHTIEKGETLDSIAKKYRVTVGNIKLFNNLVGRHIGGLKVLKIPSADLDAKAFKKEKEIQKKAKTLEKQKQYVIAFKARTGLQDINTINEYLKLSNGKFYEAAEQFHMDEMNKRRASLTSNRLTLSRQLFEKPARNILTDPLGPVVDPLIQAKSPNKSTKDRIENRKRTHASSARLLISNALSK